MHVNPYERQVYYYETDQMGIVHHSNYVRWFEEARIDFLRQATLDYAELEHLGVLSIILGYSCTNQKAARFGDAFSIEVTPGSFNGVRISFFYNVYRASDHALLATGETRHCFVNTDLMPINLTRKFPKISAALRNALPMDDTQS